MLGRPRLDARDAERGDPGSEEATSIDAQRDTTVDVRLCLFGGFTLLRDGVPVILPPSAQRLVAYMGLADRPMLRQGVAGALWMDTSDRQAQANLRSMLWRLRQSRLRLIQSVGQQISLARDVAVDVRDLTAQAWRVLRESSADVGALPGLERAGELLPDWYDDWVLIERERFRQLRLHALERVCLDLTAQGEYARAAEVGLVVVTDEPLRESAHRALIGVHLAEGNAVEALRQLRHYERSLATELGIGPSEQMADLARSLAPAGGPTTRMNGGDVDAR